MKESPPALLPQISNVDAICRLAVRAHRLPTMGIARCPAAAPLAACRCLVHHDGELIRRYVPSQRPVLSRCRRAGAPQKCCLDLERGVVWEEVIIMLPAHVSMVFLSATTPNTVEFSSWIGRTKKRPVNVIYTEKRPVPLVHFIHTGTGPRGKMFQVLDAAKRFSKTGYDAAVRLLKEDEEGAEAKAKAKRGGAGALAAWFV